MNDRVLIGEYLRGHGNTAMMMWSYSTIFSGEKTMLRLYTNDRHLAGSFCRSLPLGSYKCRALNGRWKVEVDDFKADTWDNATITLDELILGPVWNFAIEQAFARLEKR